MQFWSSFVRDARYSFRIYSLLTLKQQNTSPSSSIILPVVSKGSISISVSSWRSGFRGSLKWRPILSWQCIWGASTSCLFCHCKTYKMDLRNLAGNSLSSTTLLRSRGSWFTLRVRGYPDVLPSPLLCGTFTKLSWTKLLEQTMQARVAIELLLSTLERHILHSVTWLWVWETSMQRKKCSWQGRWQRRRSLESGGPTGKKGSTTLSVTTTITINL